MKQRKMKKIIKRDGNVFWMNGSPISFNRGWAKRLRHEAFRWLNVVEVKILNAHWCINLQDSKNEGIVVK